MNYKTKIKSLLMILISSVYLSAPAYALDWVNFDMAGKATTAMDEMMSNLGVDPTELRYSIQTMNVMRQKKMPPSVSLIFNPTNPAPGEKVTVVATPLYFMNDAKNMYFTWFLKSADCDRGYSNLDECDLNGDNRVNIEDYKIKAARIIASSNFEWDSNGDGIPDPTIYNDSAHDNDGYNAHIGGGDQRDKNNYCFIHDVESGDEYQIGCAHLFADTNGHGTIGDGSFGVSEEKFWRTDPNADDTAGTGNGDEANVAGLGIDSFSWNYEEGDEVGVVIEGISIEPAQTNDSAYRTMWAAPKNLCGELTVSNDYPKTETVTVSETPDSPIAGQTTTITEMTTKSVSSLAANIARISATVVTTTTVTDTATDVQISQSSSTATTYSVEDISDEISISNIEDATDLDECLYNSLVSPSEGGGSAERLDVSLSYFPENPLNDSAPGSTDGDILSIQASIFNSDDPTFANYTWQVYQSDEINPDSWGSPMLKSDLPDSSQSIGLGLDNFKFRLNLERPKKYLRIKLNVTENAGSGVERKGYSDIVVPISSTSEKIKAYYTGISDLLNLSLADERCAGDLEQNICPVAKNEIIGLKFPGSGYSDYAWTIDGKPFTYESCFFEGCDESASGNIAFFPITKNNGENITVNLAAANLKTGEKINLTKIFEVNEPDIKIASADDQTCGPVILGNYIDVDGKAWPDYSDINFWAISGKQIKLTVQPAGFSFNSDQYIWYVDGSSNYSAGDDGVLYLPAKLAGENYDITVSALYAPSALAKKALSQYWNVSYNQFYEKPVSDTINIVMKESPEITAQAGNKKILASLFSALPSYFAFLLRIVLTAFILLIGSAWFLSLFPNLNNEKN